MQVRSRAAPRPDRYLRLPYLHPAFKASPQTRPPLLYNGYVELRRIHQWNVSTQGARAIQERLGPMVSRQNGLPTKVHYVAGLDVSPPDGLGRVRGAVVVLDYPGLEVVEVSVAQQIPPFPYVPGLLSFRESPVFLEALRRLKTTPDIIIADAQGYAHPRRFGLACHIGLIADVPTVGCAKSILVGKHGDTGQERGSCAELVLNGEVIGMAVRTRPNVRPVYVSVGHKVDLPSAVEWVMACCTGYRLPQPTRLAHFAAADRPPPVRRQPASTTV